MGARDGAGAVVLAYHRVVEHGYDPQLLCVAPDRFAQHIKHLRDFYSPLSAEELSRCLRKGTFPPRAVIVTFDDGYADNLWNAKPILDQYQVPAIVFVATDYIGSPVEMIHDQLAGLILEREELPSTIKIQLNSVERCWHLDNGLRDPTWTVKSKRAPSNRERCYLELHTALRGSSARDRERVMSDLALACGATLEMRTDRRVLARDELPLLMAKGLIEIESHGASHLLLSQQPPTVQEGDLLTSKKRLKDCIHRDVNMFAFPYGGQDSYTDVTLRLVGQHFAYAFTAMGGRVRASSNHYLLPRNIIRSWGLGEFACRILRFFLY